MKLYRIGFWVTNTDLYGTIDIGAVSEDEAKDIFCYLFSGQLVNDIRELKEDQ